MVNCVFQRAAILNHSKEGYYRAKVEYIDYKKLKEFYTIPEVCELLSMAKADLKKKCAQYDIEPRRNEIGEFGLVKYDVRKLHNAIYHEGEEKIAWKDDPWA